MTWFFNNMQIKIKPSVSKMLSIIKISSESVQPILPAEFCRSHYRLECYLLLLFIWTLPAPYWSVSHSASLGWWLNSCFSPQEPAVSGTEHAWHRMLLKQMKTIEYSRFYSLVIESVCLGRELSLGVQQDWTLGLEKWPTAHGNSWSNLLLPTLGL